MLSGKSDTGDIYYLFYLYDLLEKENYGQRSVVAWGWE